MKYIFQLFVVVGGVFYYYIGFKLSGVKLIHGDLNNLLSFRQELRKTEDKGEYLLVALNTGRRL